jgi:hypothetical protein
MDQRTRGAGGPPSPDRLGRRRAGRPRSLGRPARARIPRFPAGRRPVPRHEAVGSPAGRSSGPRHTAGPARCLTEASRQGRASGSESWPAACPPDCTGHAYRCLDRVGGCMTFPQRKGKGKLTLQRPPALLELLREHRKRQAAERLCAGNSWTDHDLVFATRHGGPITRPGTGGRGRPSCARHRFAT